MPRVKPPTPRNDGKWTEARFEHNPMHIKDDYEFAIRTFSYDPLTGHLTRIAPTVRSNGRMHRQGIGKRVGSPTRSGYVQVGFNGRAVLAHRIIWLMQTGKWPDLQIDHINGIRNDNRLANLRVVSNAQNQYNRHKKVGRDRHLPIGIYGVTRKGRPGMWYSVNCYGAGKRMSTFVRNYDMALATRKKFESILWGAQA